MPRLWEDLVLITGGTSKTPHTKTRTDMVWDAGRGLEYILLHRVCIYVFIHFDSFEYGTFFQLMVHKNWRLWCPFEASPFSAYNIYVYGEKLKDMTIWIPVLSWAFVSILNVLRGKLTYYAYKKKTNDPAHGKLYLSQRQTVKVLMRMCIYEVSSVSLSLVHESMNVIVCKH